jgi:hypothetical protein
MTNLTLIETKRTTVLPAFKGICAGLLNSLWALIAPKDLRGVVPAPQATQPGRIESLESILGLFKSLKIRAPAAVDAIHSHFILESHPHPAPSSRPPSSEKLKSLKKIK